MKTSIFSLLPVLALAIPLALTSCADSDDSEEPNPGGPVGGAVVDYNINDYQIKVDSKVYEPITTANWREQGSIFLYVGNADQDTDIKDTENRMGYSLVNLPWAEGTVQSNLPFGFCDDIIPEHGWEWVYNLCGNRSTVNGNFFAVYNKYSGILRFFFFMPSRFTAGNDHYWRVAVSDHLAKSSVWQYGIPADRSIVDKSALGQTTSGEFMDYVTPWTNALSRDGLIVPNAGWWAFDVDMSQTRADNLLPDDVIRLQMCSWNTEHVSLASTIAANIDGSLQSQIYFTKTTVSTAKGLTESLGDIAGVGKEAYNAVSAAMSGDFIKTVTSAFSFARGAYSVYGAMTKDTEVSTDTINKGTITGTITMSLNGTIDTEGVIQGSQVVTGIYPVDIRMDAFDMERSHLGQGTWNLKVTPVVYRMPYFIDASPGSTFYGNEHLSYWWPYVFDPNSIEVELNPNVFPESEIEWMQVDALCVSRKNMSDISKDNIRKAFGLQSCIDNGAPSRKKLYLVPNYESINPVENFIYAWNYGDFGVKRGYALIETITEEKEIHSWDNQTVTNYLHTEVLKGAGADNACIEPVYEWRTEKWNPGGNCRLPFLEVNVMVLVKMKGMDKPILLSRNYLPEFKDWDASEFERSVQKPKPYSDKMEGRNQLRDYQNKRIYDYCKQIGEITFNENKYVCIDGSTFSTLEEVCLYTCLFDGNPDTYWASERRDNVYFVEFYLENPLHVTSYSLTTSSYSFGSNDFNPKHNPKSWKLYAKKSRDGEGFLLDQRSNEQLPTTRNTKTTYEVSSNDSWQYFRFEVTEVAEPNNYLGGYMELLYLGELELNGD